jgi:hypothetical protein
MIDLGALPSRQRDIPGAGIARQDDPGRWVPAWSRSGAGNAGFVRQVVAQLRWLHNCVLPDELAGRAAASGSTGVFITPFAGIRGCC